MSINAQTFDRDIRSALNTYLTKYFNGASHNFNIPNSNGVPVATAIAFPSCDVTFEKPQMGFGLSKPRIVIQNGPSEEERENQMTYQGRFKRLNFPAILTVFTNSLPSGATPSVPQWDVNDGIQNLIGVLFDGNSDELATAGLRPVRVQDKQMKYDTPPEEYQVSVRIVTLQAEVVYPNAS